MITKFGTRAKVSGKDVKHEIRSILPIYFPPQTSHLEDIKNNLRIEMNLEIKTSRY